MPAKTPRQAAAIEQVETFSAHNYAPLPVVLAEGRGATVTDIDGNEYLDCLSAYSAVNFGHCNERLVKAAQDQLHKLTLTSRAFYSEPFGPFAEALAKLCNKDMILPMNSGAEAVESGIKVARKWGYEVKGVPEDQAQIIVMDGNFHGRTVTIVSFSDDDDARVGFGPFTGGFVRVPYGDADAVEAAINEHTVAVLLEPIQGEAGVKNPPEGFLQKVREITKDKNVLMIADEIQSGLGRCGTTFACDREGVVPDVYLLGKALGGGIMPLSAVVANNDILGVLQPGQHGSTFGGNPLACAVGSEVVKILDEGDMQKRSAELGERLAKGLAPAKEKGWATEIRVIGLWCGLDVDPKIGTARELCYRLMDRGILAKDTHGQTIRFAPPIVITEEQVDELAKVVVEELEKAAEGKTDEVAEAAEVAAPAM